MSFSRRRIYGLVLNAFELVGMFQILNGAEMGLVSFLLPPSAFDVRASDKEDVWRPIPADLQVIWVEAPSVDSGGEGDVVVLAYSEEFADVSGLGSRLPRYIRPRLSCEISEIGHRLEPKEEGAGDAGPGMAWSEMAASAYRAYAASTGNKNFRGEPMPAFEDLPQPIRTAWEAASRQVGTCLEFPGIARDREQRWAGWTPPHLRKSPVSDEGTAPYVDIYFDSGKLVVQFAWNVLDTTRGWAIPVDLTPPFPVDAAARVCHEANRLYCQSIGDNSQHPWEEAADWQRKSAVDGVLFLLAHPDAPASATHDSWMKAKRADGWKYGPVKDPEKKEHPCFVLFEQLPKEQQAKDHLFQAVVKALAPYIPSDSDAS